MEEIIGLSKSKVEFEEIWKRFHCALFVVLLIYGLYYTAEKYERILVRPDEAWKVRTRTEAVNGIGDLKVSDAEMLISLDPLSVPDKFEGREMWKNPNTESVPETEKSLDITVSGVNTTDASESPTTVESESGAAADSAGETTVPAVLTIYLHGNGGTPEIMTLTEAADAVSPESLSVPFRLGKVFDGWYLDAGCTVPFSAVEEGAERLELYAGWRELTGFVSNDAGYITSCTGAGGVADGILALPADAACTGIESGALSAVAGQIEEIYIPANITYIGAGAFDGLPNLMYIEAAPGNPNYYSENGILYTSAGEVVAAPVWYGEEE